VKQLAFLIALCIACAVSVAHACTLGLGPGFAELVKSERSVVVFAIETLAVTGQGPDYNEAKGRIRVLRTLKGAPAQFRFIRIPIGSCGLRMQVGEPYVVATSQDGKLLDLNGSGRPVLSLPGYQLSAGNQYNDRNRVLREIGRILETGHISNDFPGPYDLELSPFARPAPPPPVPDGVTGKRR